MGAPYPPAGEQKQHTERPNKVYAEQYQTGHPLPIGATTTYGDPPMFNDGLPRVFLPSGPKVLELGAWVISNRYTGAATEVISNEEYLERFGPGGGPPAEEGVPL